MSTSLSGITSSGVTSSVPQVAVDAASTSISSLTPDEKCSLLFD
ncbi:22741_t:CDS:1, partial [Gigaspora margarita]